MNCKLTLMLLLCFFQAYLLSGKGLVNGKVVIEQTGSPVEYATVELINLASSSSRFGTVTDKQGRFSLENIPLGTYELSYSFLGLDPHGKITFTVDEQNPVFNTGELVMSENSQDMEGVTVVGNKADFINKIDKKVFNVSNDLMSSAGSLSDLMQKIPSVQVDIDGNVSLRGSENVQILINGKMSNMTASNPAMALQQIPAASIERIEIITNPSARYRPDGTAGIINIVMKKDRRSGVNGSIAGNVGNKDRYNSTLSLNYNPGKVNLYTNYGIRLDNRDRSTTSDRTVIDRLTGDRTRTVQKSNGPAYPISHLVNGGIEWNISPRSMLELSASYINMKYTRKETTDNLTYMNGVMTDHFSRYRYDKEYDNETEVAVNYSFSINENQNLSVDVSYSFQDEKEDNRYTNTYIFDGADKSKDNTIILQQKKKTSLGVVYDNSSNKNLFFEAGTEIDLNARDDDFRVEELLSGTWTSDTDKTNRFKSDENNFAVFALCQSEINNFGIKGGLRGEFSRIKSNLVTLDSVITRNYWNIYPTVHTSYRMNDKHEVQINYSLRVNRPKGSALNPFPEYKDPLSIKRGNPLLKAEKIHSIEAGHSFTLESFQVMSAIYYRYTFNKITEVSEIIENDVLLTTKENLSSSQAAGVELVVSSGISSWLKVNFNTNVFYNRIDASELGFSSNESTVSWYASLNANFEITTNLMIQLNTRYVGKTLTPQGYNKPSYILNTGARYDILYRKLSLLVTVSDVFNSYKSRTTINTATLKRTIEKKRPSQIIYVGAVYNFGQTAKKPKAAALKYDESL